MNQIEKHDKMSFMEKIQQPENNTRFVFEEQFAKKEKFEVAGGTAEVVDIRPENAKTDVPVFFAPAWACTAKVYKPALERLSETNRRVISLNHPRIGGLSSADLQAYKTREEYPPEELRKALSILDVLEQKGIEKVDVITHSEAAINVAIAATLHPEKFRNIVFFAPAGMIGEDTFSRLLKGFKGQSKRPPSLNATVHEDGSAGFAEIPITETQKQVGAKAFTEVLKYFAKNPVRAINETLNISKSQIHTMLRYLHERGIGIVVMASVDDPVFPMDKMQEIAKADMLDGFLSVRGGHGMIGEHPELYVTAAEQMLSALEAKKQKNSIRILPTRAAPPHQTDREDGQKIRSD